MGSRGCSLTSSGGILKQGRGVQRGCGSGGAMWRRNFEKKKEKKDIYGFVAQRLPGEEQVVDVGRNGDDEVEGVLVDDTFTDVVELCGETCGEKQEKPTGLNVS